MECPVQRNHFSDQLVSHPNARRRAPEMEWPRPKGVTVGEREEALGELLLREPEIITWLAPDDGTVGNDWSGMDEVRETLPLITEDA
jgi:hypothetical protein